jgi:hypothetical protein
MNLLPEKSMDDKQLQMALEKRTTARAAFIKNVTDELERRTYGERIKRLNLAHAFMYLIGDYLCRYAEAATSPLGDDYYPEERRLLNTVLTQIQYFTKTTKEQNVILGEILEWAVSEITGPTKTAFDMLSRVEQAHIIEDLVDSTPP